jgi:hypothetical protein
MSARLVIALTEIIETWEPRYPDETRFDKIRETCWNWFSGGSTAKIAAQRIEAALQADGSKVAQP